MRRDRSKTGLFMMEMIIVILFFAVSAAVCVKIFAASDKMEQKSVDINQAVLIGESAAESYKAAGGDLAKAAELVGGKVSGTTVTAALPKDGGSSPYFSLEIKQTGANKASITVSAGGAELFRAEAASRGV